MTSIDRIEHRRMNTMYGLETNDIIRALALTEVQFTPEVMEAIAALEKATVELYEACSEYGLLPLQATIQFRPLEYHFDEDAEAAPVETPEQRKFLTDDRVRVKDGNPKAGACGTIVSVYSAGTTCRIEFDDDETEVYNINQLEFEPAD